MLNHATPLLTYYIPIYTNIYKMKLNLFRMREINLLQSSPKAKRVVETGWRKEENKIIAKRYDKEFFDGERVNGYGGYYYDGRWKAVVKKLQELYGINSESSILDIGCAKGFLLYDLQEMIPGIKVDGIDISKYALNHALDGIGKYMLKQGISEDKTKKLEDITRKKILPFMIEGSADKLPWPDSSFDVVLSINTIHNLPEERCRKAVREMLRVGRDKKKMFIEVDAYRNEEEKQRMKNWVLTAETLKSVSDWIKLYREEDYDGDYFWFIV